MAEIHSAKLLRTAEARNPAALARIRLAKRRIQSVLDRDTVCHQRTLEQKISEQGPNHLRVDPHLVGLALMDLVETNRLKVTVHRSTKTKWYSNPATPTEQISAKVDVLAPLYDHVSQHGFGNLTGDALELIVFKCLDATYQANPRYAYQGHFHLDQPKQDGRYRKTQPMRAVGKSVTTKEADFLQFGHDAGPLCIECKNYREWIYPHHRAIADLIIKAHQLHAIPVLVARRFHYTTRTNFLEPAGIIAHETLLHYYPADQAEVAALVNDARGLGFTDVTASEEPHPRSTRFFTTSLPTLVRDQARLWKANKDALLAYATYEINLAQLYNAIGSPAAGNWVDPEPDALPDL